MNIYERIEGVYAESRDAVEKRWNEFLDKGRRRDERELYSELVFCLLTANWNAHGAIKFQNEFDFSSFLNMEINEIVPVLKKYGHRFPNARSEYIYESRWIYGKLGNLLDEEPGKRRAYLARNVKGLGYKEASHFARNTGEGSLAILDKHILRVMHENGMIDDVPKSLSPARYMETETKLKTIEKYFNQPIGKLDLYLWYSIKGVVEK